MAIDRGANRQSRVYMDIRTGSPSPSRTASGAPARSPSRAPAAEPGGPDGYFLFLSGDRPDDDRADYGFFGQLRDFT